MMEIYAQQEFAPIGAVWYFDKVEDWNPPDEGYVKFISTKDTTINNLSARIIHQMYYTSRGDSVDWGNEYIHQSGDTIFYLVDGVFKVLYNFSEEKGDTMEFYSDEYNPCNDEKSGSVLIDSIYTQTINNVELKGLICSPTDYSAWQYYRIVEKLGSYSGFYSEYVNTCGIMDDLPAIGSLRCYSDNELGLYKIGVKPCDTLIAYNTNFETVNTSNSFFIYPTKSNDKITIEINSLTSSDAQIEVYNIYSQLLSINKISSTLTTIDISGISEGIYTIRIIQDGKLTTTRKFIKL